MACSSILKNFSVLKTEIEPERIGKCITKIINTLSFRKLAGKTQVILSLTGPDVRTRLTHTIEVAKIAKSFRMKVVATRRSATKRETGVGGVDEIYPLSQLPAMLSESDFVVVSVPLTPETTKLLGEKELRAMKPSAFSASPAL